MSDWQGFDPRKVCPNCGGYQTSFGKRERIPASQQTAWIVFALAVPAFLLLAVFIVMVIVKGAIPDPGRMFGLLLTALLGIGTLLFNKDIRRGFKASEQDEKPTVVYSLSCSDCGHTWERTVEEWERMAQQEREELVNSPAFLPQSKDTTVEPFEKIKWSPPDPNRGVLIIVGVIALSFIAFLSAIGALWFASHPGNLYAPVIGIVGILMGLLVYAVLAIVLQWKVAKLLRVMGIGFLVIALWFLFK
jgi:hypothetical protein